MLIMDQIVPEWIRQQTVEKLIKFQTLISAVGFLILKFLTCNTYTKIINTGLLPLWDSLSVCKLPHT